MIIKNKITLFTVKIKYKNNYDHFKAVSAMRVYSGSFDLIRELRKVFHKELMFRVTVAGEREGSCDPD